MWYENLESIINGYYWLTWLFNVYFVDEMDNWYYMNNQFWNRNRLQLQLTRRIKPKKLID